MHVWKNAQITRTNKRIKQGNTRKIKKIKNYNNTTIVPEGVIHTVAFWVHVITIKKNIIVDCRVADKKKFLSDIGSCT